MSSVTRFLKSDEAATSVEYAVMLAMILIACMGAVAIFGQRSSEMWSNNDDGLQAAFAHIK